MKWLGRLSLVVGGELDWPTARRLWLQAIDPALEHGQFGFNFHQAGGFIGLPR